MKMKPMVGKILVKLDEKLDDKMKGGIIIPGGMGEGTPRKATIEKLSKGRRNQKGEIIPFEVQEGNKVLISLYGGIQLDDEDSSHLLIEEEDILAIIEE